MSFMPLRNLPLLACAKCNLTGPQAQYHNFNPKNVPLISVPSVWTLDGIKDWCLRVIIGSPRMSKSHLFYSGGLGRTARQRVILPTTYIATSCVFVSQRLALACTHYLIQRSCVMPPRHECSPCWLPSAMLPLVHREFCAVRKEFHCTYSWRALHHGERGFGYQKKEQTKSLISRKQSPLVFPGHFIGGGWPASSEGGSVFLDGPKRTGKRLMLDMSSILTAVTKYIHI